MITIIKMKKKLTITITLIAMILIIITINNDLFLKPKKSKQLRIYLPDIL